MIFQYNLPILTPEVYLGLIRKYVSAAWSAHLGRRPLLGSDEKIDTSDGPCPTYIAKDALKVRWPLRTENAGAEVFTVTKVHLTVNMRCAGEQTQNRRTFVLIREPDTVAVRSWSEDDSRNSMRTGRCGDCVHSMTNMYR